MFYLNVFGMIIWILTLNMTMYLVIVYMYYY